MGHKPDDPRVTNPDEYDLVRSAGGALERSAVVGVPPPDGVDANQWRAYVRGLASRRPYLWKNHSAAIESGFLAVGRSAVLTFPTGAGKSVLCEMKIVSSLLVGLSVVYLVPTRALVDQIEADLRRALQKQFGRLAVRGSQISESFYADVEIPNSRVSIMTPERCLAIMATDPDVFQEVGLIVFDECHLLHGNELDHSRRALDSMLCLLRLASLPPKTPDFLLMSAMVSNGRELAAWIQSTFQTPCSSLDSSWKPTRQARGCVVYEASRVDELRKKIREGMASSTTKTPPSSLLRQLTIAPYGIFCLKQAWSTKEVEDYVVVRLMESEVLLAASGAGGRRWFLTPNRNKVAAAIGSALSRAGVKTLVFATSPQHSVSVADTAAEYLSSRVKHVTLTPQETRLHQLAVMEIGSETGVYGLRDGSTACHHGLLLSTERLLIESLFRRIDGIGFLAATPTLAQGMNLPVEAVLLAGDDRFDPRRESRERLQAHELLNASGRAGRAGHVATGVVLVVPGDVVTLETREGQSVLGRRWFELQKDVFAQSDQCVEVVDPIGRVLDALQERARDPGGLTDYFLYRLPLSAEGDEAPTRKLLNRSLAAFKARGQDRLREFEDKVQLAIVQGRNLSTQETPLGWEMDIASNTGVPVATIQQLASALHETPPPTTTMGWIEWFTGWLRQDPLRLLKLLDEEDLDLFAQVVNSSRARDDREALVDAVRDVMDLWMKGSPLVEMEGRLSRKPGAMCHHARRFAVRTVGRISFAVGLIPLVVRRMRETERTDAGGREPMAHLPAVLGSLAACAREGYDAPEKLVVHFALSSLRPTSRVFVHAVYAQVAEVFSPVPAEAESFPAMMRRVSADLSERLSNL